MLHLHSLRQQTAGGVCRIHKAISLQPIENPPVEGALETITLVEGLSGAGITLQMQRWGVVFTLIIP